MPPSYLPGANQGATGNYNAVSSQSAGTYMNGAQQPYPTGTYMNGAQQPYATGTYMNGAQQPYPTGTHQMPPHQHHHAGASPGSLPIATDSGAKGPSGFSHICSIPMTHQTLKRYEFREECIKDKVANATVTDLDMNMIAASINADERRDFRGGHRDIRAPDGRTICEVAKERKFDVKNEIKQGLKLKKSGRCIYDANGTMIASITEKSLKMGGTSEMVMANGRVVLLEGGKKTMHWNAVYNEKPLFSIQHITASKASTGKDVYYITVQPDVCSGLAIATCLIFEDLFHSD